VKRRQASPRAAKRAREVVTELGIRDPEELTVELIAAHYGAMTFYRPLRNEEGRLLRKGGRGIIVVADGLAGTPRARFVAAHELGHFLLHEGIDQYFLCQTADLTEYRSNGIEAEANQFAAELLMPEPFFAPLCDRNRPCLDDLVELSKRFATSLMATAFRLARFSPEPFAAVVSQKSRILYAARSSTFPYYFSVGQRLSPSSTYAGELHCGRPIPGTPQFVDASAWVDGDDAGERDVLEHSMALGETGLVLSTLWLRDDDA